MIRTTKKQNKPHTAKVAVGKTVARARVKAKTPAVTKQPQKSKATTTKVSAKVTSVVNKSVIRAAVTKQSTATKKAVIAKKAVAAKKAVVEKPTVVTKKKAAAKQPEMTKKVVVAKKVTPVKNAKMLNGILTDAAILGMPDSQYMCHAQLEFFRAKLIEHEQEILENAKKTTQAFQEQETNYIADPSDRATIEEEYALELRTRDRERKLLQKIRKALHMIETGDYGYCEDTGEPIGVKRLIARPTATLTIEAQERREKLQKHFADD